LVKAEKNSKLQTKFHKTKRSRSSKANKNIILLRWWKLTRFLSCKFVRAISSYFHWEWGVFYWDRFESFLEFKFSKNFLKFFLKFLVGKIFFTSFSLNLFGWMFLTFFWKFWSRKFRWKSFSKKNEDFCSLFLTLVTKVF